MNREFVKRASFLGVIAWVSVCLLAVGLVPRLYDDLSSVLAISGLLGLVSSVGLFEVLKTDRRARVEASQNFRRSRRDELTGLSNRWEFDRLIHIMLADAASQETPLSLILIDVDRLREVNLQEGFVVGDDALRKVSESILAATRGADLVARYGDDEFAVVLSDVDRDTCEVVVRRIRGRVNDCVRAGQSGVTVSVGATSLVPDDDLESLVQRAELALFRCKSDGRDRGCYHDGQKLGMVQAVSLVEHARTSD